MELELIRDQLDCWEAVLDTDRSREETMEAIVPDACPDVGQIADVTGQVCLTDKQMQQGALALSGHVNVTVLYRPEEGQSLCRMEVKLPFTFRLEDGELEEQDRSIVRSALGQIEARALNPRKLLLRAQLCFRIRAYRSRRWEFAGQIDGGEQDEIQQLKTEEMPYYTSAVKERDFTFEDEVRLTDGPGGAAEVLSVQAEADGSEAKVIGSKLIFKGELALQIRYLAGGELCSMRCPLAFSQIIEVSGVGEDADCQVELCVAAIDYAPLGEDGRTLSVSAKLLAQAAVGEQRAVTLLQDAYSTRGDLAAEQAPVCLPRLKEQSVHTQSLRQTFPTDVPADSVIDAGLTVCSVTHAREDDRIVLTAQVRLAVLYRDGQGEYRRLEQTATVSDRVEAGRDCTCRCFCRCPDEVYAVPAPGGIEVRGGVDFCCRIVEERTVPAVTAVKPCPAAQTGDAPHPSVILRLTRPGERIWDVAKAYSTTARRILQANLLEGDELSADRMLLIPNAR